MENQKSRSYIVSVRIIKKHTEQRGRLITVRSQ